MPTNALRIPVVRARRTRVAAPALGAILALALWLTAAPAAHANLAQFQNGDGITVVSQTQTGREIDLTVNTADVQGQHKIIVLLPEGYSPGSTTRYPALYLLNGALADP